MLWKNISLDFFLQDLKLNLLTSVDYSRPEDWFFCLWWIRNARQHFLVTMPRVSKVVNLQIYLISFPIKKSKQFFYFLSFHWFPTFFLLFISEKSCILSVTSDLQSWLMRGGKSAISFAISRYSYSSFSKTPDLNSYINVWIGGDIVLIVS